MLLGGNRDKLFLFLLLLITFLHCIWSFVGCHDLLTWILEAAPLLIALLVILPTYKRFPLSNLLYFLIFLHGLLLLRGAHYTYAQEPLFSWLRDTFELSRNHYDRLGHFFQGFVPAIAARELFIRQSVINSECKKWRVFIILAVCLGISGAYELIEWLAAEISADASVAFLATQGDGWDTQKDMAVCLFGAICSLLTLSKLHDKSLKRLTPEASGG